MLNLIVGCGLGLYLAKKFAQRGENGEKSLQEFKGKTGEVLRKLADKVEGKED